MKRMVVAESLIDTFLKYHNDPDNYDPNKFDRMYAILEKYSDSDSPDGIDTAFRNASKEDQLKMIELIKPDKKVGEKGYAQNLYYQALEGNFDEEYCKGIVDAIEALFEEGWVSEENFRTDL